MKLNNLKSKDSIEETSSAGGGAVSFGAGEERIREVIRNSIKIYSRKKKNLSQESLQETKLRNLVKKLILEQAEGEETQGDVPVDGTWKNVLSELLNIVIPQMREKYTQLQTNIDERNGFKEYVSKYYNNQFQQVDNADQLQKQQELEEQEKLPKIDQLKVKVRTSNPDFIDIDDKSPREKPEKKKKEEPKDIDAQTDQEIGQTFADEFVQSVGDRVLKDYKTKVKKGSDRENFKRVFFANIDSWYEIWDENEPVSNATGMSSIDEPVPELGGAEEVAGSEAEPPLEPEEETLEEDLFSLLEADLE